MHALNWHQQSVAAPPVPPGPLSARELKDLGDDARHEYATRVRTTLRGHPLTSPLHDRVCAQMTSALESALLEPRGARTILALSAPYSAGKSTMIKRWAHRFQRAWLAEWPVEDEPGTAGELPRWAPKPGYLADVIPITYISLPSDTRATDLYAQLLAFTRTDDDLGSRARVRMVVEGAVRAFANHGTRLVIIDDAHMLRTTSVMGRATLDAVKHLNTELGELGGVLALVGANLTGGDVLEDEQIRGRLAQHSFNAYEIDTVDGRRDWQRFLKACEISLLPYLPRNGAGDFAQKHSAYLWTRTQGYVSDTARLLIDGTAEALVAGRRLDRSILGGIRLSQRAEDAQRDLARVARSRTSVERAVG